ncbi:MAG: hypothetical protein P4N60_09520 [Verrucomicrobiae bacterium]|nr:hypothetical protein [Verrucomicrobiae bacterium]
MNKANIKLNSGLVLLALASLLPQVSAADAPAAKLSTAWQKPVWLTELSLGVKESYDDNLLLVSGAGMKPIDSAVTTVSPKIGFNFAPLLGKQKVFQVLSVGYAPDLVTYHSYNTESYNAHRIANTIKGGVDAFTFNLDNNFAYIDGSQVAPIYSTATHDDQRSAFATGGPRERLMQIQDRTKIVFQYDLGKWFVRPTASLLLYDLMTDQRTTAGYQNYASRYDANGGLDIGYKVTPSMAFTLGYRYGHQYQEQFSTVIDKTHTSSPNDYQRILGGFEGQPFKWLTLSVLAGPDFRSYDAKSATHTTPLTDLRPTTYYAEAAMTATFSPKDTVSFKYKQWQWVASTGKLPLFDSSYDVSYHHIFSKKLSADLGCRIGNSDYTQGNTTSALRDDWMYTVSTGINYAFTPNISANLTYALDLGRNNQDVLAAGQLEKYREFDHNLVSLGVTAKF